MTPDLEGPPIFVVDPGPGVTRGGVGRRCGVSSWCLCPLAPHYCATSAMVWVPLTLGFLFCRRRKSYETTDMTLSVIKRQMQEGQRSHLGPQGRDPASAAASSWPICPLAHGPFLQLQSQQGASSLFSDLLPFSY